MRFTPSTFTAFSSFFSTNVGYFGGGFIEVPYSDSALLHAETSFRGTSKNYPIMPFGYAQDRFRQAQHERISN